MSPLIIQLISVRKWTEDRNESFQTRYNTWLYVKKWHSNKQKNYLYFFISLV